MGLIAAVTVIVIVTLVLRSRSAMPKTRLVCPAKRYHYLKHGTTVMYKLELVYYSKVHFIIFLFRGSVGALATTNQSVELSKFSEATYASVSRYETL